MMNFFFRVENRLSALEADIQTLKEGMKNGSWPLNLQSIPEEETNTTNKGKTIEENGQTEEVQEFISSLLKSVDNRSLKWFKDNLWGNFVNVRQYDLKMLSIFSAFSLSSTVI